MNDTTEIKISVIVAVRNNPEIWKNIDSFLTSTYEKKELVVVNDCSTDSTESVIKKYDITLINLSNHHGPAIARNKGAEAASGDVLFFLDSDAILHQNTLEKIAAFLGDHSECHGVTTIWDDEPLNYSFFAQIKAIEMHVMFTRYFKQSFGSNGSAIYRETFFKFGGFSSAFKRADAEDFELGLRLFNDGIKIPIVPTIVTKNGFVATFTEGLKKYVLRAFLRSVVLRQFKNKYNSTPITSYNSLALILIYLFSLTSILFCIFSIILYFVGFEELILISNMGFIIFLILWLIAARHILIAFNNKKGFIFFICALLTYFILTACIGVGGVCGRLFNSTEGSHAQ